MRVPVLLLIAVQSLNGCAPVSSELLPPVKVYSAEVQEQAADELEVLPEGSVLPLFVADYAVLREQLRSLVSHRGFD